MWPDVCFPRPDSCTPQTAYFGIHSLECISDSFLHGQPARACPPLDSSGRQSVADPGFEKGPGAVTRLNSEHDKRSVEGEALALLGGPGACFPENFENRHWMLRYQYAFSALLGVSLSLNKGSKLFS